ncbi:MAG: DUF2905 domain-containing protein [Candidatus Marinimicrobia bacterium]|nr:DUF2905 domain-containing protein [Candidatus Neomarinimicrobiota bacterium]MCF7830074.1 DUF2905 domain-containing protein [Candidatus Neomarinimicrobiota bacterium]MCF7882121.1 DUF2905 domain-containing protein [Candidatus Neomarinimicrobiota bacterium]
MDQGLGEVGKWIMKAGGILVVIGGLLWVLRDVPLLQKLGQLPGDIRIEKDNFTFYFPLTTSILISLILTGILWLFKR